jgi:SPP1 gp7 family putative phage head morphogenesis protein
MKREITASKPTFVKGATEPKTEVRKFASAVEYIVEQMGKLWKSQVLKALNRSTVEKFEDAQTGNFSKVFLTIAKRVNKSLVSRFDDKRIEELANLYTKRADRRNQKEFYEKIESIIGVSRKELESTEGLTAQINAITAETAQWIKKLRNDTLQEWTANTLRQMAEGKGIDEISSEFDNMVETRKGHAKMVARTQIGTFNSLTAKARAQNLGITKAVWVTSKDERVRAAHVDRDGKEFDLSEGLYSSIDGQHLIPGTDFQCRCVSRFIIPGMED